MHEVIFVMGEVMPWEGDEAMGWGHSVENFLFDSEEEVIFAGEVLLLAVASVDEGVEVVEMDVRSDVVIIGVDEGFEVVKIGFVGHYIDSGAWGDSGAV